MDKLSLLLSFATLWLALSYILFTSQQYFSVAAMLITFLIVLATAIVFILSYSYASSGKIISSVKTDRGIVLFLAIVTAFVLFEVYFNAASPAIFGAIPIILALVVIGVLISLGGIYFIKRFTKDLKSYSLYAVALIGILIVAAAAYGTMYSIRGVNWNGIDELAFNYYASYLFVHGTNPYLASMQTILQQRNIFPTIQLDGKFEYAYDYPALSFMPYVFMPLFGASNFFVFIMIAIFLSIFAAYVVYRQSGYNNIVLLPLGVWLFTTYIFVGTANQYLAVSVLFLLAYLERRRAIIAGVLLGLAASIIQLAWFAVPFLFALMLRESGGKNMLKSIVAASAAFAVVNSYFIILAPAVFFHNIFEVFGLSKLIFYGPNIMQFFVSHFPVAPWYPAALSVTVLLVSLALFYTYTDTLKPFIAVAPAMIFFLTWRNISIYGLPFIPVILAIYYVQDNDKSTLDLLKDKRPIIYAFALLVIIFAGLAIYSNTNYTKSGILRIASITPILYGQQGFVGPFSLGGLRVDIVNNGAKNEPVSFYIASRSPNGDSYILSQSLNITLMPYSSYNYTLQYQLPLVDNSTKLYIFAFCPDYIASKEYMIRLSR